MPNMNNGSFIISLDFELIWGALGKRTISNYGENLLGVRKAIPTILDSFKNHGIKSTFSTVGFLFCENKEELMQYIPKKLPQYLNEISPYGEYLKQIGTDEDDDPYHYAYSLIKLIQHYNHEISTHTFSHYYCLEEGQNINDFEEDLKSAIAIANSKGINIKGIVFPRNQFNSEYIKICENNGLISYRGNEKSWMYKPSKNEEQSIVKRLSRLLNSYLSISGYNVYDYNEIKQTFPYNIPSSAFLRPYSNKLALFEKLRIKKIKKAMTYAAKNNKVYHLWWHPHNFGINLEKNMHALNKILEHYIFLNKIYKFESLSMNDLAVKLSKG